MGAAPPRIEQFRVWLLNSHHGRDFDPPHEETRRVASAQRCTHAQLWSAPWPMTLARRAQR